VSFRGAGTTPTLAYRRAADAFRSGDLGAVERLIAPEVAWHVPGEHQRRERFEGAMHF
jgi:hypothetical protein